MSDWKNMPDDTRVWIYQANRILSKEEQDQIRMNGNKFVDQWSAHGSKMNALIELFHDIFVVVFADEAQTKASGCSIDASVHFVQAIEKAMNINFFDRMQVAILKDEAIQFIHAHDVPKALEEERLSVEDMTFNNLIATTGDLKNNWRIPISASWLVQTL